MNYADRLGEAISRKKSVVVVGLDPRLEQLPQSLRPQSDRNKDKAKAILDFNEGVLDAVKDIAVAVKPQVAFYEPLGAPGWDAYMTTARMAQERGLLVIGDVKRGDIGSTAAAYAEAHLADSPFDAITVNPYLGTDSMTPFLDVCRAEGKGLYVLVKTSNPSSADFQNALIDGKPLFMHVAHKVAEWGDDLKGRSGMSSIGAVVGATHPNEAKAIRDAIPNTPFLVPGYGAQGGKAEEIACTFGDNGVSAVVNSSRGIIFAYAKDRDGSWTGAVQRVAEATRLDLERVRIAE